MFCHCCNYVVTYNVTLSLSFLKRCASSRKCPGSRSHQHCFGAAPVWHALTSRDHGKQQVGNHHFDLPHRKSERPCFFSFFPAWPKCTWSGAMALPATILFSTIFDLQPIDMALRGSVLHFWLNGNVFPMLNGLKNLDSGFPFQGQRNFNLTL